MMTALRWLLFIPLAFAASILAGAIGYWFGNFFIVRYFGFDHLIGQVFVWTVSGLGSGLALIFVGMKIAPLRNNKVKWTLVIITMTLGIVSALGGFFGGHNKAVALAGVVMVFIAIGAARSTVEQLLLSGSLKGAKYTGSR
jgi:hypothetical protein